jgi:hypothetical protein
MPMSKTPADHESPRYDETSHNEQIRALVQHHVEDVMCNLEESCLADPRFAAILDYLEETGAMNNRDASARTLACVVGREIARQLQAAAVAGAR